VSEWEEDWAVASGGLMNSIDAIATLIAFLLVAWLFVLKW